MMHNSQHHVWLSPRRDPIDQNNHAVHSQPVQQAFTQSPLFSRRNERIDWRRIAATDLDRIVREMDFQTLQDNLQQITFCNIDSEVDTRMMDPNFLKLFKLAQFTIEYLLTCQDQISTQLIEYENLKNKFHHDKEISRREIDKLKEELIETKKESKKRRKMLETQQRMLMAQNSNYHTCPVCTHAFLSYAYLEAHMNRRHPDYQAVRRVERDVDAEKQIQRLRDELMKKEMELQGIRALKGVDDEKIHDRDATIRQLKDDNQMLTSKITNLDQALSDLKSNARRSPGIAKDQESETSKLFTENIQIRQENDALNKALVKSEQAKQSYEREIEMLQQRITTLMETIKMLQSQSSDKRTVEQLVEYQQKYEQERLRRVELEKASKTTTHKTGKNYEPTTIVSPAHSSEQANKSPTLDQRPSRIKTSEILLPRYCPLLTERIKENPKILAKYRIEAEKDFRNELESSDGVGIMIEQTQIGDLDCRMKMEIVTNTRRAMQDDLPNFEQTRAHIVEILNKKIEDLFPVRRSNTSIRSATGRFVTFRDEKQSDGIDHSKSSHDKPRGSHSSEKPSRSPVATNETNGYVDPNHGIDALVASLRRQEENDISASDGESNREGNFQPAKPIINNDLRPQPRKLVPGISNVNRPGIAALPNNMMRPTTTTADSTRPLPVKQAQRIENDRFESDDESFSETEDHLASKPTNFEEKRRTIEKKLQESNAKGQRPATNWSPQGFVPSRELLNPPIEEDEDEEGSLTTIHTGNPTARSTADQAGQNSGRNIAPKTPLSSGEIFDNTYDSIFKSNGGLGARGTDFRRPATADSAKTSNMDSDDNLDEDSNHN